MKLTFPRLSYCLNYSLTLSVLTLLLISCGSKTKLESEGQELSNGNPISKTTEIGTLEDGQVVHREETVLTNKIRRLENQVLLLEERLYGKSGTSHKGLLGDLQQCAARSKDPEKYAAGPASRPSQMNERARLEEGAGKVVADQKTGLLKITTEEDIHSKLGRLNKDLSDLEKQEEEIQNKLSSCKREVTQAN